MTEVRTTYRPPELNSPSDVENAIAPVRDGIRLAQAHQALNSLFGRPVTVGDAVSNRLDNRSSLPGIHPTAETPIALSEIPLGPDHPSLSGLVYAAGNQAWLDPKHYVMTDSASLLYREKTGLDYVTANASGLPAGGMEGDFVRTPEQRAQMTKELEALQQKAAFAELSGSEKLSVRTLNLVLAAEKAPQNIRNAVTAFWDNVKGWIPQINTKFKVALSATASAAALAACGGAGQKPPEPTRPPAVTLFPTATAIRPTEAPPTATSTAIPPSPTAAIPPTPEIRVTPTPTFRDGTVSSREQAAYFRGTNDASALALADALSKSNNLVAPVRLADGTITYPGVDIQTSTELRDGKVVSGSMYSFAVINEGPNKGALIGYTYATERDPATGALLISSTQKDNPLAFILTPRTADTVLKLNPGTIAGVSMQREKGAFVAKDAQGRIVGVLDIETVDGKPPVWRAFDTVEFDGKTGRYVNRASQVITGTVATLQPPVTPGAEATVKAPELMTLPYKLTNKGGGWQVERAGSSELVTIPPVKGLELTQTLRTITSTVDGKEVVQQKPQMIYRATAETFKLYPTLAKDYKIGDEIGTVNLDIALKGVMEGSVNLPDAIKQSMVDASRLAKEKLVFPVSLKDAVSVGYNEKGRIVFSYGNTREVHLNKIVYRTGTDPQFLNQPTAAYKGSLLYFSDDTAKPTMSMAFVKQNGAIEADNDGFRFPADLPSDVYFYTRRVGSPDVHSPELFQGAFLFFPTGSTSTSRFVVT